jgi:O-antigen/teichoic acid export membrane protein
MTLSPGRRRVLLTLVDKGVSSASNFATGVVVARLAGAAQFGQYMLTLMIWLVVVGLHRSLITEPVIVTSRDSDDRTVLAHGVGAELLLGIVVGGLVAVAGLVALGAGAGVGLLMLVLSPFLVPLLVQDYWRAMAFQQRRPGLALANDLVFATVQVVVIAGSWLLGWRSAGYVIVAWGAGATAGALLGLYWFPAVGRLRDGWRLLRRLWPQSRWMLADQFTGFASDQAFLVLLAFLLTPVDYGGFRAALALLGPLVVLLHAGCYVGLPEASRRAEPGDRAALRRFTRQLTAGMIVCAAIYGILVATTGKLLLGRVYGVEFTRFGPLATLAVIQYFLSLCVFGQGIALKATGQMRRLWRARLLVAAASLTSTVAFVPWFGVTGAGWAGVVTGASWALAVYAIYRVELGGDVSSAPVPGRPDAVGARSRGS